MKAEALARRMALGLPSMFKPTPAVLYLARRLRCPLSPPLLKMCF
jgi:hypothetical protein